MSAPIIAKQDEAMINQLVESLPQSVLIVAEPGLDDERIVSKIILSEPSEVLSIVPEEKKKTIGVEQIRSFVVSVRTYAGIRRIGIFKPAQAMTEEAQNALLKILEEPPKGLHLILVTDSTEQILPTIASRCQVVNLSRTSNLQDRAILKSSKLDEQSRQQVLFLASGRPALIRQLVSNPDLLDDYRQFATDAKTIIGGVSYQALASAQRYSSSRDSALKLVDVVLTVLRFQMKKHGPDPSNMQLLHSATQAEAALKANGNVKLALLQLAVR